jgi:excinuclease ABC subunit B
MKYAIDETNRRRAKQVAYNKAHGIVPVSIHKAIRDLTDELSLEAYAVAERQAKYEVKGSGMPRGELQKIITELEKQMKEAARNLEFEKAAALRDEMYELKTLLAEEENLKPWERIKLMVGEE